MIIAIGGVSRSGKTKLTKLLKELLGDRKVATICQDDYAYPISDIPMVKELTDWECPESINFSAFKKALLDAMNNNDHVIIEGFLVFSDVDLLQYYDRSIFTQINKEAFLDRRSRDSRWEVEPQWYMEYVWNSYLKYGQLPQGHEALTLDGSHPISEEEVLNYLYRESAE